MLLWYALGYVGRTEVAEVQSLLLRGLCRIQSRVRQALWRGWSALHGARKPSLVWARDSEKAGFAKEKPSALA